jgi:hypothetical protein
VEVKIYFVITFVAFLLVAQSVCSAQNFATNISNAADTTNQLVHNDPTDVSATADYKSSEDNSVDNIYPSFVLRNYPPENNRYSFYHNRLESIPLSQSTEKITISNNANALPMIDGTYWREKPDLDYGRLFTVFGGILTVDMIAYMYQREIWYREETTVFHSLDFSNDMKKWQYMDKIGHFMDAYFVSDLTSKLYRWSGLSGNSSVWYGALTGWLWTLQIEISDGFMAEWGFSWGDLLANTLGAGFFVLQQFNYDLLGGIHPKISWHKSDAWKQNRYYRDPGGLIEDYEGMTFWLTVNFHHYVPDKWKEDYPKWLAPLGVAFGYGAKGIAGNPWGGRNELFVGMDIDLRKIPFLDDWDLFRFVKSELNFIRLPLPTIRISQSRVWYGFHF